jgi:hypothetical protein
MAFAASADAGGTARRHATVNFQSASARKHATVNWQSAAMGRPQTGDNVTIGSSNYNSEDRSFDRPWPFGPEANPQ